MPNYLIQRCTCSGQIVNLKYQKYTKISAGNILRCGIIEIGRSSKTVGPVCPTLCGDKQNGYSPTCFIFWSFCGVGWGSVHLVHWPLISPRWYMIMGHLVEWELAEETCPNATLSTTNPTWPELRSNPDHCSGKQAIIWAMAWPIPCYSPDPAPYDLFLYLSLKLEQVTKMQYHSHLLLSVTDLLTRTQ
jgi:hypothetical protein